MIGTREGTQSNAYQNKDKHRIPHAQTVGST